MKHELHNIEQKINKLDERLDSIDVNLAVYNEQLKEHIRRTELLEEDVSPIKEHVSEVRGFIKLISAAAAILGIVAAVKPFL
jgi:flagellar motor component MotA